MFAGVLTETKSFTKIREICKITKKRLQKSDYKKAITKKDDKNSRDNIRLTNELQKSNIGIKQVEEASKK